MVGEESDVVVVVAVRTVSVDLLSQAFPAPQQSGPSCGVSGALSLMIYMCDIQEKYENKMSLHQRMIYQIRRKQVSLCGDAVLSGHV